MINEIDKQILMILQQNARTSNAELARQVGLVPSAVLERVRKLEERGIIEGYSVRLNARKLGLGLVAFVFVRTDDYVREDKAAGQLAAIPEVLEVHHVAGEDCFLVKVRAEDTEQLGRILREKIATIKSVRSTRTTIVLNTSKETRELPLELEPPEGGSNDD
ncbi:MAG TPA: Lrp/AsnC family transcriptional regulator [Blastocatellia bacterium]|nr:Lrp/AsnC family transcriptional regulator [Blastocatellia bacterium]